MINKLVMIVSDINISDFKGIPYYYLGNGKYLFNFINYMKVAHPYGLLTEDYLPLILKYTNEPNIKLTKKLFKNIYEETR